MKKIVAIAGSLLIAGLFSSTAFAQGSGAGGRFRGFEEQGGEALYKNICQGCHMPNAQGAVGAGMYPALAKNPKLEVAGYPIAVVVNALVQEPMGKSVSGVTGSSASKTRTP